MSSLPLSGLLALATVPTAAELPPELAREMTEAIVRVDKAMGLESWPARGVAPCVDRGGLEGTARDVGVEETRRCAEAALKDGFPALGKGYVLAVLMASIGPSTVVALGIGEAAGWGAYSCDPGRKCPPMKMVGTSKWGARLLDRQARACKDQRTVWLPAEARACP